MVIGRFHAMNLSFPSPIVSTSKIFAAAKTGSSRDKGVLTSSATKEVGNRAPEFLDLVRIAPVRDGRSMKNI